MRAFDEVSEVVFENVPGCITEKLPGALRGECTLSSWSLSDKAQQALSLHPSVSMATPRLRGSTGQETFRPESTSLRRASMMKTGMSSGLSREKPSLVQISVALGETYSKSGGAGTGTVDLKTGRACGT